MKAADKGLSVWTALLCALSISVVCLPSPAANVTFNLVDFMTGVVTGRVCTITPLSTPRTNTTSIIVSERQTFSTGTSGGFTVTNMQFGAYQCALAGRWTTTTFVILCPDTNATLNARDLIVSTNSVVSSTVGYTQAAADSTFVHFLNGTATNLTLRGSGTIYGGYNLGGGLGTGILSVNNGSTQFVGIGGVMRFQDQSRLIFDSGGQIQMVTTPGIPIYSSGGNNTWYFSDSDTPGTVASLFSSTNIARNPGATINLPSSAYLTNAAGPAIYFGNTNNPTFAAANGSLFLSASGNGIFYFRTNGAWVIK